MSNKFFISFIGGGKMAQAFVNGLIKTIKPNNILVSDPNKSQHLYFKNCNMFKTEPTLPDP